MHAARARTLSLFQRNGAFCGPRARVPQRSRVQQRVADSARLNHSAAVSLAALLRRLLLRLAAADGEEPSR